MNPMPDSSATDQRDRVAGMFLAGAVGDALGWPVEPRGKRVGGTRDLEPELRFSDWTRRDGGGWAPHEEQIPAGTYSDDTQLTIAVARSHRYVDWWEHLVEVELPLWLLYDMGGGGAIRRAAQSWLRGVPPWHDKTRDNADRYYDAGANGVAMRVAPHVARLDRGFLEVRRDVLRDGLATHGHPRALVGAQLFAYACWVGLGLRHPLGFGELIERCLVSVSDWAEFDFDAVPRDWSPPPNRDFGELWGRTVEECLDLLELCSAALRRGSLAVDRQTLETLGVFSKSGGAGTISAAAAIYLASRHASQPRTGLLSAAYARGADSDTLAAMTGALLGSIHGHAWLGPLRDEVQDGEFLGHLAMEFCVSRGGVHPSEGRWTAKHRTSLLKHLAGGAEMLELPAIGRLRVIAADEHPTRAAQDIRSWWLESDEHQRIRIKRITKEPRRAPEPLPLGVEHPEPQRRAGENHRREAASEHVQRSAGEALTRAGFVVQVRDLEQAVRFYRDGIGFELVRGNGASASFGWLALELSGSEAGEQRRSGPSGFGAITVFVDSSQFAELQRRLADLDVPLEEIGERRARRAFVCHDPDGNRVEVRVREPATA